MTLEPFALAFADPLETARGPVERREGFLVHVQRDGATGVGEATPLPPWTEPLDACREALEGALAGDTDPSALDAGATPAAAHGLELAALDAESRAAGVPLAATLTDRDPADSVPVNATVGDADPPATAADARAAVEEGFAALKLKVGARDLEGDVERLRAVRDAVGPDVELRADANGAWGDVDEARAALARFSEHGVSYVEQPLPADDLAGHAGIRGGDVGVALDESLWAHTPEAVLAAGAADVLVLKPMALGGPARAVAAAERALDAGVTPVVTTTVDAVHARTAAVHVAATLPDPPACGLATARMLASDLADDPAPVVDGRIRVPAGPGTLGTEGRSP